MVAIQPEESALFAVVLGSVPSLKGRKGIPKYNLRLSVYFMLQIYTYLSFFSESREPCPYICFGPWILTSLNIHQEQFKLLFFDFQLFESGIKNLVNKLGLRTSSKPFSYILDFLHSNLKVFDFIFSNLIQNFWLTCLFIELYIFCNFCFILFSFRVVYRKFFHEKVTRIQELGFCITT